MPEEGITIKGNVYGSVGGSNNTIINYGDSENSQYNVDVQKIAMDCGIIYSNLPKEVVQNLSVIQSEISTPNSDRNKLRRAFDSVKNTVLDERFAKLISVLAPIVNALLKGG